MGVNRVVYGNKTLIDLSDSTVTPETLLEGVIAYNSKGERIIGIMKKIAFTDDGKGNVTVSGATVINDGDGNTTIG